MSDATSTGSTGTERRSSCGRGSGAHRVALRGCNGHSGIFFVPSCGVSGVGSDSANALWLDRLGVSRRHAALVLEGSELQLIDQRSKNGTYVNGQRIASAVLQPGDELWIGSVTLRVEALEAEDAELALELSEQPARSGRLSGSTASSMAARRTTGIVNHPIDPLLDGWLGSIRRCFRLLNDATQPVSAGLSELARSLEADAAMLVETCGAETTVYAAVGRSFEPIGPVAAEANDEEGFVEAEAGVELWMRSSEGCIGLALAGHLPERPSCRRVLGLFLDLYRGLRLAPGSGSADVAASRGLELCFPDGYVEGASTASSDLHKTLKILAAGDLPVLLTGETGVGKEVAARILHLSSARRAGPFVAINCAAVPAELLEAELFGIGKGVATGVAPRRGRFALAAGGTLFLDEIGEMSRALQAKLLRALQEMEIQPLGEAPIPIELRIVAATNVDIEARLDDGSFRRDLFYRLAGFELRLPPLRERPDDLPILIESFLRRSAGEVDKAVRGVSRAALAALETYPWPGNVRELEHEMRRLVQLCPPGQAVRSSMLSPKILAATRPLQGAAVPELPTLDLGRLEAAALAEALRRTSGNRAAAAELLGISRFALRRRIERHGL